MTGVNSYLPEKNNYKSISGLGLNEADLLCNHQLTDRVVHNLNRNPILPYKDSVFDSCIISSGIQYLINPVAILKEVGRVLKGDASIHISYTNNLFPEKAVTNWLLANEKERYELSQRYVRCSGCFQKIEYRQISSGIGKKNQLFIISADKSSLPKLFDRAVLDIENVSRRYFISLLATGFLTFNMGVKKVFANDVSSKVIKITVEQLGVNYEDVKISSSFVDDLGADSLDTVELVMAFEEEFDIEIPDETAEKINTVNDAINIINAAKLIPPK